MGIAIPNSKLCMWLFLGTEIMFFTAFIGTYIVLRLGSKGWPTDPDVTHIRVAAGGINTFVLILSSYFVVVAHEAMGEHNFAKARTYLQWTFALAFVFLGIKSYEYYGKISHDILPGHVAESDQQAKYKVMKEAESAVNSRTHRLAAQAVNAKLVKELPEPKGDLIKLRALIGEAGEKAEGKSAEDFRAFGKMYEQYNLMKQDILAERTSLHEVETQLAALQANEQWGSLFNSVHEPHPILYGNIFASCYFLMTGFHALHVVIGMILFGIALMQPTLEGWHDYVENSGLYWHFVDLVWIFLFPLLYIV
jgi:cytochrome c oxidase subunit 3